MADRNLELALRIKSDFDKSVSDLRGVQKEIEGVGQSTKRAQAEISRADIGGNAVRQAKQLEEASKKIGEAASKLLKGNGRAATEALAEGAGRAAIGFGAVGLAVAGVTAAIGVYATAVYKAYRDQQDFERALITTGNVLGMTSEQLVNLRDSVGSATGEYGNAKVAVLGLASSGKVAADSLAAASRGAVALANLTGQSIEQTTNKMIELADAPTRTLAKLNEQYHFLTEEVYSHVKALEDQGRAEDAARVALEEFARVHEQRVQEAYEKAGTLERAWIDVKTAVKGAWQAILDIGKDQSGQEKFDALAKKLQELQNPSSAFSYAHLQGADRQREIARVKAEMLALQQANINATREAGVEASAQRANDMAIALDQEADRYDDAEKKRAKRIEQAHQRANDAVAEAMRAGNDELVKKIRADEERIVKGIEAEAKTKSGKPNTPKPPKAVDNDAAAARELANLQKRVAMLGELEEGETRASEAARIRYEITQGAYKAASPALQAQLKAAAADLDNGRKQIEVAKQLVAVRLRAQELQGNGDQVRLDQTIQRLEQLRRKAVEIGDLKGAADIAKLMNLETAKSQLDALQRSLSSFYDQVSTAEQKVTIDRENGLISSVEAQRRLLEIRQQEIAYLQEQIPLLEQQNSILQDPAVAQSLEQMKLKLYELQQQGSLLETTFRNTFEQGLGDALYNITTQTTTLKEGLLGLVRDVTQGLARLAAQQLASVATAKVMQALFKTGDTSDVGAGAAKLQAAALTTGLAGGAIAFGAKSLGDSAKELAAAASLLLVANSVGGFAEGGYTGPGSKYQVAGYVHKGEGVLNQQEIGALGGPRGFYALREAIADGSLHYDGSDAPAIRAAPRFTFAEGGMALDALPRPEVSLAVHNYLDMDELVGKLVSSPRFDKALVNKVGENGQAIQAAWAG